ncbi:MAG: TonB-dependent receptor [Bacteroidaceae bacterium]|nr:TonB-dependent receptor [Bacteroidaceae bacterium]
MKRILLHIFFLIIPVIAWAGDSIRVSLKGRVIDDKNEPVSLCLITVEGQEAGTTADLDGKYSLSFNSADSVVIIYKMMGYRTRRRVLQKPQGSLTLNIVMYDSSVDMAELEIKELRRQMGQTQELNTTELKRMPSNTGNAVEDLVATQAGVSQHNELSSQYNVRGGSFDENCVYINGGEVYRPLLIRSGEQEGLSVINPFMVNSVRFSAGGFEAKYADKMSSVLDIEYRKPTKWEGDVSLSLLGASAYMGWGNSKLSVSHSLRYKTNAYLLGALETEAEYSPNFVDYQAFVSWKPAKDWTVDVIGYVSHNSYKFTPATRETNFGTMHDIHNFMVYFDGWEEDLFQTFYGTARIKRIIRNKHSISLNYTAFSTRERETYDIQGQYWLSNVSTATELAVGTYMEHARNMLNSTQHSVKLVYDFRHKEHHIEAGVGYRHETVSERTREWEFRDSSGYSMPHNPERLDVIYNLRSTNSLSSNHLEMYAQDTWRRETSKGIFSLNYGVRLSYWSWNNEWLCSPRTSLTFVPKKHDNMTFRLATGLYYQRPFYKELRDTVTQNATTTINLNKEIQSQRSFQVIAGYELRFKLGARPFLFSTELYYKAQDRLNPYTVDNTKIVYYGRNCATGNVMGLDLKLYGEFVPGTDSWLTFSLMRARMELNGKSIPQPTDQTWSVNMFFSDYFPGTKRWKMNLKACFAGGLPFGAPHTGLEEHVFRSTTYKRVDVGMNFRALNNEDRRFRKNPIRNIWLGLDCLNVFGFDNVSGYYWVTDVKGDQYAVPNYLTGRMINFRVNVDF